MKIQVNGEPHEVEEGMTIIQLLKQLDIDPEQSGIAVAKNQDVVLEKEWEETTIDSDSEIEIIHAVQGG